MADETYNVIFDAGINAHLQNSQNLQKEVESSITQGAKGAEASLTKTFANAASGSLWSRKQERLQQGENKGLARMSADESRQQYYGLIKRASTVDDWRKIMDKAKPTFEDYKWANTPMNSPSEWDSAEMYAKYDAQAKIEAYNTAQMHYEAMLAKIEAKSGETATRVGGFFKAAFKGVGKFASDIFTRMRNQLIRQIARQLLNLGKEGLKLLVNWDRTFGNNTSHAAETMDHLSAKWTELKKSIGAAFMPIIQILQPIIDGAIDLVISLFNTINQIARTIQGYGTYMKATYKVTKQTTGAAKELKRVLFGFDELNILPSNTGSGAAADLSALDFVETDNTIKQLIDGTISSLNFDPSAITDDWNKGWKKAFNETKEGAREVWNNIKKVGKEGWKIVSTDMSTAWEETKEGAAQVWGNVKRVFGTMWGVLKEGISQFSRDMSKAWNDTKEGAAEVWANISELWESLKTGAETAWNTVSTKASEAWASIKSTWDAVGNWFDEHIVAPIQLLWLKFQKRILEDTPDWLAKILGIDKNSKLAELEAQINVRIKTDTTLSRNTSKLIELMDRVTVQTNAADQIRAEFEKDQQYNTGAGRSLIWPFTQRASGGSVPNRGSLILANEAGPEVVANMGGATGIMNTSQMEAAIANGNTAVVAALYDIANEIVRTVNNKDTSVYLDGNKVGASVTKYQNNYSRSFGV